MVRDPLPANPRSAALTYNNPIIPWSMRMRLFTPLPRSHETLEMIHKSTVTIVVVVARLLWSWSIYVPLCRWTDITKRAHSALRSAGVTNLSAELNEVHMGSIHLIAWYQLIEYRMGTFRITSFYQSQTLRDTLDMRIDRENWHTIGK